MYLNRRQFLLLTTCMAAAGCQSVDNGSPSAVARKNHQRRLRQITPRTEFIPTIATTDFSSCARGEKLFAISSYCTHRKCKLSVAR